MIVVSVVLCLVATLAQGSIHDNNVDKLAEPFINMAAVDSSTSGTASTSSDLEHTSSTMDSSTSTMDSSTSTMYSSTSTMYSSTSITKPTSNYTWPTNWETLKPLELIGECTPTIEKTATTNYTLYVCINSTPNSTSKAADTPEKPFLDICTHIEGQFMIKFPYNTTTGTSFANLYIPQSAVIDYERSSCAEKIGWINLDQGDKIGLVERPITQSDLVLSMFGGSWKVTLHFTNDTKQGSAGWMAWTITSVRVQGDLTMFPDSVFPDRTESTIDITGKSEMKSKWWKTMSTFYMTTLQCNHQVTQKLNDEGMEFTMKNVLKLSALNAGWPPEANKDKMKLFASRQCFLDYENDDLTAVIIGSVQTGFVVITLIIYMVYLKRRGPVKVPNWMIEPAMRNATIEPITEEEFERTMSQAREPEGSPLPQKRNGNKVDEKY